MNYESLKNILDNYETEGFTSDTLLIDNILNNKELNMYKLIKVYFVKEIYNKEINELNKTSIFNKIIKCSSNFYLPYGFLKSDFMFIFLDSKIFDSQFKSFDLSDKICHPATCELIKHYNFNRDFICDLSIEEFNNKLDKLRHFYNVENLLSNDFAFYKIYCNNPKLFFTLLCRYSHFNYIEDGEPYLLLNLKGIKSLSSNVKKQILRYLEWHLPSILQNDNHFNSFFIETFDEFEELSNFILTTKNNIKSIEKELFEEVFYK